MDNNQTLFNHTVDELEKRSSLNDKYELLMTTPLLRKLLIDGENSLIHQVNKNSQPLLFKINNKEPLHKTAPFLFKPENLKTYFWAIADGLDPVSANKNRQFLPQELSLDNFLKKVVIYAKGNEISIRDLIKHLSDKEGGVHKQKRELDTSEIKNKLLREFENMIEVDNVSIGFITLRAICRVTIRALSVYK